MAGSERREAPVERCSMVANVRDPEPLRGGIDLLCMSTEAESVLSRLAKLRNGELVASRLFCGDDDLLHGVWQTKFPNPPGSALNV